MSKKVVVGMSGGVDSSMTAYLLKEKGYEVIGVTMEMWRDEPDVCEDGTEAKAIADAIGIPHVIMHFKPEFEEIVVNNFISEYLKGRTPNPCVLCNREIKWRALMERGKELGADYVATGHYAKVEQLTNHRWTVRNAKSVTKDQTYVLASLTQEQLSHTLMPLGDYEKPDIRNLAASLGLEVAKKKDSQDVCFIDDNDYGRFLRERIGDALPKPGNFVLSDGTVIGQHAGIHHYTIGQRKGLNISYGKPLFVNRIDVDKNEVVLGDDEEVFSDHLFASDMNFMIESEEHFDFSKTYLGRIRYAHKGTECRITPVSDRKGIYRVDFLKPVRAVTPGQTVVLYDGEYLACGGIIC